MITYIDSERLGIYWDQELIDVYILYEGLDDDPDINSKKFKNFLIRSFEYITQTNQGVSLKEFVTGTLPFAKSEPTYPTDDLMYRYYIHLNKLEWDITRIIETISPILASKNYQEFCIDAWNRMIQQNYQISLKEFIENQ